MKYIITESKLEKLVKYLDKFNGKNKKLLKSKLEKSAIRYLNEMYGDLEVYRTDKFPDCVYFVKDGRFYMRQDLGGSRLYIDNDTMWSELENIFGLNRDEIKHIITKWAEQTYNLIGVIPVRATDFIQIGVGED